MCLPPNSVTQPQQATAPAKAMSPETVALMKKVANLDRDYGLSAASDGTHFSPAMLPVSKLVDMRKTESSANNMQRPATNAVASTMRPYSRSSTVPKHTESLSSTESGFLSRKSQSAAAAFVSNLGANLRRSSMTVTSATRLQGWDAEVQAGGDTGDVSVSSLKARTGSVTRILRHVGLQRNRHCNKYVTLYKGKIKVSDFDKNCSEKNFDYNQVLFKDQDADDEEGDDDDDDDDDEDFNAEEVDFLQHAFKMFQFEEGDEGDADGEDYEEEGEEGEDDDVEEDEEPGDSTKKRKRGGGDEEEEEEEEEDDEE
ncbi:hypothetical protein CEUSTIGMA_g3411.t1 [Chlamydomonas eustigma]|uniref:Uncharacterized protein n=1 Tax=Chlamydomonas eustigma TaxID=1157962 RepID=A0A250WYP8_9CHLO|nr:hypothetical protein CEUSTIGMA_g3411.t1 [Chlamydomonas eustigma]|eukprot:GAX75968.1 hypothetical protein CEUSTIGMA_g3411.t1 [Chlamydomonas eustigma]